MSDAEAGAAVPALQPGRRQIIARPPRRQRPWPLYLQEPLRSPGRHHRGRERTGQGQPVSCSHADGFRGDAGGSRQTGGAAGALHRHAGGSDLPGSPLSAAALNMDGDAPCLRQPDLHRRPGPRRSRPRHELAPARRAYLGVRVAPRRAFPRRNGVLRPGRARHLRAPEAHDCRPVLHRHDHGGVR